MTDATTDITWIDVDTKYPCIMIRNSWGGHLCGYVILPAEHPLHGVPERDIAVLGVEVHGGVTYAESAESLGGMATEWAVGFDCGHFCDKAQPKNEDYVRAEVIKLAHQLKEITQEQVTAQYSASSKAVPPYTRESMLSAIDAAEMLGTLITDLQKRRDFTLTLRVAHAETELGNFEHAMKIVLKAVASVDKIELE